MNNKKIYEGCDPEMLNHLDGNLRRAGQNYWKLRKNHFPRQFRASYVNIMMTCPDTGNQKKHIMGPYSKNIAQSIMTDYLAKGECCWVEEDWIR